VPTSDPQKEKLPEVQLAAGGLVWQTMGGVKMLAVIHRPKYDDWTLPKGKPEPNETLAETALREVREELGCEARFVGFAGVTHYPLPDGREKVVLFWNMVPICQFEFLANSEVDRLLWLKLPEAVQRLSHQIEKDLVGP